MNEKIRLLIKTFTIKLDPYIDFIFYESLIKHGINEHTRKKFLKEIVL